MSEEIQRPGYERRMTRDEINALPLRAYTGEIHVLRDKEACRQAVSILASREMLGFDTETRPTFQKGVSYTPSLVQLADDRAVYLFQLRRTRFSPALRRLLARADVVKAGVAIDRDITDLRELAPFEPGGFIDLADMARRLGLKNHGLRGLSAVLLGFRISKRAQRSNWARDPLSDAQIRYAATDAWVSRLLYFRLRDLEARTASSSE